MTILITIVVIAICLAFTMSLYEAILYSTRSDALEAAKEEGTRAVLAARLLEMKKKIGVPIAAIVIMSTIASTGAASLAGMYAAHALGASMVPLFSGLFALAILLFGEIAPKTLGALYWRSLWPFIVWPLKIMEYALYPLIVVSQGFSHLITRGHKATLITEAEILASVRMGAMVGEISHDESLLVHNIINLENRAVREIMTPRVVIFSLDADLTVGEAIKAVDQKGFTRIPIYEGDRENIIGYIIIHDLFSAKTLSKPDTPIRDLGKPISFVPQTSDSLALLTGFLKKRRHIAVVVDEYGGVAGLITLEDLIETVLGREIVDETDRVVDLRERARQLRGKRRKE